MSETERVSIRDAAERETSRERTIIRTSFIGIAANVLLASLKAVVGLLSRSIAITLDAVNNLSDAASSVITIVGTKLARKPPDRKHPFGHGRIEYLTAMIIALIILYAGVTSLVESVKKILNPVTPDYSLLSLALILLAVVVKIVLGRYVQSVGERVQSDSLTNSGADAMMDAVISASTLLGAAVFLLFRVSLEAWLGGFISVMIIRSGVEMLREGISRILGEHADASLAREIKSAVCEFPPVSGAYDLVLHNYGPDAFQGTIHIEVPDTCSANQLDELIREITVSVCKRYHVLLTAIGVYSLNTQDAHAAEVRETLKRAALNHPYILEMHGFYLNEEKKTIRYDVIVSFDAPDRKAVHKEVVDEARRLYPDYEFQIAMDTDFSEP